MKRYKKVNGIPLSEENRFSVFVRPDDKDGYGDLIRWKLWFQRSDIECVIAKTPKGFALYRLGQDDA